MKKQDKAEKSVIMDYLNPIKIEDIYKIKQDKEIYIKGRIIHLEKHTSNEIIFYIVKLFDRTGTIESCISPKYYTHDTDIKILNNKLYKIKLQCIISEKHPIPLLFIKDIIDLGFPPYMIEVLS